MCVLAVRGVQVPRLAAVVHGHAACHGQEGLAQAASAAC